MSNPWDGHTPGPWSQEGEFSVMGEFDGRFIYVASAGGLNIGSIPPEILTKMKKANAALIASAPELAAENERLRAALKDAIYTICVLCKRSHPQHKKCKSCLYRRIA